MYMQVETRSSSCLHLKRAPGVRSWSLLVGILSIGLAAAYYSGDSLGWKLFYVTGCLLVAVQNLEDWEEAIFNKNTGKVILKTFSLYRKLLTLLRAGHDQGGVGDGVATDPSLHSGGPLERHPGRERGGGEGPILWEGLHGGAAVCHGLFPPSHPECYHGPPQ
nr:cytochrome b-245 chaperone 1 isoform X1 [Oryctolagus cuniculus]